MWQPDDADPEPPRRDTWGRNPCGCGSCSACGMFGMAPRPKPPPKPTDTPVTPKPAATLFD